MARAKLPDGAQSLIVKRIRSIIKISDNRADDMVKKLDTFVYDTSKTVRKRKYRRPRHYRKNMRERTWQNATRNGQVLDPLTRKPMKSTEPWHMGHKPGHEFHKLQQLADHLGLSRKEFMELYQQVSDFRPELPASNMSHLAEGPPNLLWGITMNLV